MARHFDEPSLVIASHNPGKVREIADLLLPFGIEVTSSPALDLPEPDETGETFLENAEIKARETAEAAGQPVLADDSGLVVSGLAGLPGIYSARWAGPDKDFRIAMARVEDELKKAGVDPQGANAHFICVLSLCWPDGHCESFEGRVDGTLRFPPSGDHGFGYDPIFVPDGHTVTFGEMDPDDKHGMSHRARAFQRLIAACFDGH